MSEATHTESSARNPATKCSTEGELPIFFPRNDRTSFKPTPPPSSCSPLSTCRLHTHTTRNNQASSNPDKIALSFSLPVYATCVHHTYGRVVTTRGLVCICNMYAPHVFNAPVIATTQTIVNNISTMHSALRERHRSHTHTTHNKAFSKSPSGT